MAPPRLTIGMATFDDFDGVYFTVTSLMIHHQEVMSECEILVVDNNPDSEQGNSCKIVDRSRPQWRLRRIYRAHRNRAGPQ